MASRTFGPGPGAYMLPSSIGAKNGPQFSFGVRTPMARDKKSGPGPAAYNLDKMTRYGKTGGLQFSILDRSFLNRPHPASKIR